MGKNYINVSNLDDECNLFCYYLINQKPNKYVSEKYQEGHKLNNINRNHALGNFDKLLINIARISPLFTRLVDVYTRIFFKNAVLRKKLVLLLAILESCAPTHNYIDSVDTFSKTTFYIRMFEKGLSFIHTLLISSIIFMPFHILFALGQKLANIQPKIYTIRRK